VTEGGLDAVRVSMHVYNNTDEVGGLTASVKSIAGVK
jgi:selenocysteine lyase/cysteine desulfurase